MRKILFIAAFLTAFLLILGTLLGVTRAQVNGKTSRGENISVKKRPLRKEKNKAGEQGNKAPNHDRWRARSEAIKSLGVKERNAAGEANTNSVLSASIPSAPTHSASNVSANHAASPNNNAPRRSRTTRATPPMKIAVTPHANAALSPGKTGVLPKPSTLKNDSSKADGAPMRATGTVNPVNLYRVGINDVLDIRLLNATSANQRPLYTVLNGGLLDYPLAGAPMVVSGMTPDEIAERLRVELQQRTNYKKPQVNVSVREYASHSVIVTGQVIDPGYKFLRSEGVPLHEVIASARPRPEAERVRVASRTGDHSTEIDLRDQDAMNMLVQTGDVVEVLMQAPRFYYIGGEVDRPGEKEFRAGMTLTQALLAESSLIPKEKSRVNTRARAALSSSSKWRTAKVTRQSVDNRLTTSTYNLKDIASGTKPDPVLQPGDRIEISY